MNKLLEIISMTMDGHNEGRKCAFSDKYGLKQDFFITIDKRGTRKKNQKKTCALYTKRIYFGK